MAKPRHESSDNGRAAVPLRDKVAHLSRPQAYPDGEGEVEVKETHMAFVFLVGERVYKLKKPVEYRHRDCHRLASREFLCREEIRLNRRLAPDVYLGVEPLGRGAGGALALSSREGVVDWLVVMRRLPEDRLLDEALARGDVAPERIDALADLLGHFYAGLAAEDLTAEDYVARFVREQAKNREIMADRRFAMPGDRVATVLDRMDRLLDEAPDLVGRRVREGRIKEGHGDLRPEHVCLVEPPVVIDCLEFNRNLRLVDPFDELSLLALECERLGGAWIGERLFRRVGQALEDAPDPRVLAFYRAYRACLRARLSLSHLLEPHPRDAEAWEPLARDYLALAASAVRWAMPD
ncbi:hypothetical protein [Halomonas nitroreducens]|uniref:hypothetical protein n=1 Tax=Halomonas nitroreducens TaxID=447425 RepID=UPI001C8C442A|nr:hypothetical protein [Halomonas nitroreducens]